MRYTQLALAVDEGMKDDNDATRLLAVARAHIASSGVSEEQLMPPGAAFPFLSRACASRYLLANDGDFDVAAKQLVATVDWRARERPWEPCPLCAKDGMSHNMRLVGYDAAGHAVIFTSFGQAHDRKDKEVGMRHLTWVLESTAFNMEQRAARGQPSGEAKWVWWVDYEGFGLSDCSPVAMKLAAKLLAHYPERLAKVYMAEAPYLFWGIWKMVTPILKQRTKDKVAFVAAKDLQSKPKLRETLGPVLADWLSTEMAENRMDYKKRYWEWWLEDGSGRKDHDPRGTPDLVRAPEYMCQIASPDRCYSAAMEDASGAAGDGEKKGDEE